MTAVGPGEPAGADEPGEPAGADEPGEPAVADEPASVVVLGAGRVGRTLEHLMRSAGDRVRLLRRGEDPAGPVRSAATVLLTVGDDELASLVADLAAADAFGPGQLVVHLSGARGLGVLEPAAAAGARTAAAHPVLPFTGDPVHDSATLATAAVGLSADGGSAAPARELVAGWGVDPGRVIELADADRPAWHAAICVAANHGFASVVDGAERLARLGIHSPEAVLSPVVRAAVELALASGPGAATGPVARGDAGTVAEHLAVAAPPDSIAAYRASAQLLAGQVARALPVATARPPRVARAVAELDAALEVTARPRALVMTMGALHAGHLAHLARARELVGPTGAVVLSIFVNPLQFGPGEDLASYPRTLDADLAAAATAGVDVVFAPTVAAVYPNGQPTVRIDPGPLGSQLEGAARPGHFAGVLTVVSRVLRLVAPDVATFGEKDYQQLTLVRAMVADLGPDVAIHAVPTVREADGLAMSSRNIRLGPGERARAAAIPLSLRAGVAAGRGGSDVVLAATRAVLASVRITADSLALRAPDLGSAPGTGPARLLLAAVVGGVRLLDNVEVDLTDPTHGVPL